MAIPDKDIKALWGLAAGRCAFPECREDCLPFVDQSAPSILGEMAHVIAQSPRGPRGRPAPGDDKYENLILLCPTHHRLVDGSAADSYSADRLRAFKAEHEQWVRDQLTTPSFGSCSQVARAVLPRLQENHAIWKLFGPESDVALRNPISNTVSLWHLRKLAVIIPNNAWIVNALRHHRALFDAAEYEIAVQFIEHASAFEASAYERLEAVPRFPVAFEEMIRRAAAE